MKTLKIKRCYSCNSNFVRLRTPFMGPLKRVHINGIETLIRGYWVECFDCGKNSNMSYTKEEAVQNWNKIKRVRVVERDSYLKLVYYVIWYSLHPKSWNEYSFRVLYRAWRIGKAA